MGARRLLIGAVALAVWPGVAAATDCPPLQDAAGRLEKAGYRLDYRFEPARPPVGAPFSVEVALCGPGGPGTGGLDVDADMPAHRHAMNYRPEVRQVGPGRYRAEGLLFHMPGAWRLRFAAVRAGAPPVRLDTTVTTP